MYWKKKKKKKEKKRERDNNPNPRKLTLNIRTKYCFSSNKSPIIYVFIHWAHKKEGLLISCLRGIEQIYKFNESVYLDRLMEVERWMPCFVEFANYFSILTLWLLGTSNKLVEGCD